MSLDAAKLSNYIGQTEQSELKDYLLSVDNDLSNLFRATSVFNQFGTGNNYSVLTYTSTNYVWFPSVGAWNITNSLLYGGSGASYIGLQPNAGIWMGDAAFANAVFSVDQTGQLKAHAGRIGGWYIGTSTLSSTNLIFDSSNELMQNRDFVSGPLGQGWRIGDSLAEFQNVRIRGKVTNATFERDVISSVGGNLLVCDSDVLVSDMSILDNATINITSDTTFAVGDILRIKDSVDDEWFGVTSVSHTTYTVTRDSASAYAVNTNPAWKAGTAVVNFGAANEGLIFMTASEANAPHIDVVTHAGLPWSSTGLTTRMRIGNVNGFLGATSDMYGMYIGETDKYLKYDPTNGLQIKGIITAESGSDTGSSNQLLDGGDFEKWTNGDSSAPDWWTLVGAGASIAKEDTIIKIGTYSAKLTRGGSNTYLLQYFHADKGIAYWQGRTITLSCWVYATVANRARVMMHDGVASNYSSFHTGDSTWQLLTVTLPIDASATQLTCRTYVITGDTVAYFDGAMVVEGSVAIPYAPKNYSQPWIHPSDTTKIDGGTIFANSVVTCSLSACTISSTTINTSSLTSSVVVASTLSAVSVIASSFVGGDFTIVTGGSILSSDYVASTTGFKLTPTTGLEINTGTIKGDAMVSGTINAVKLSFNPTMQIVYTPYLSEVRNNPSGTIPFDDTVPQSNEGDEYMTQAITPNSATNKLLVDVVFEYICTDSQNVTIALFQDNTSNAAYAIANNSAAGRMTTLSFSHYMDASTTNPTTIKIRAGGAAAADFTFNGNVSGGALYSGTGMSSIRITEIAV